MAILGIKTWKMENIAENDRKEGIRTRQGFGELIQGEIKCTKSLKFIRRNKLSQPIKILISQRQN